MSSLHVAYLDESYVVELEFAPSRMPCIESFRHKTGLDILLYKIDDYREFKKLLARRLKMRPSVPTLYSDVCRFLRRRNTVSNVYLIRKHQGPSIFFAEIPESLVVFPEAYMSLATLRTDNGVYDIKVLDFNLKIEDCRLCMIYRHIDSLGGDELSVSMFRALTISVAARAMSVKMMRQTLSLC